MLQQAITPAATSAHRPIRLTVMQGQARVSGDERVEFTTVLGSCIACCLFDASVNVGGMNHFLLAEPQAGRGGIDENYGVYLMEVLINEMLAYGASRLSLRAHLYGGANMYRGMKRIGTANAEFAKAFLERERIPLANASLGGNSARRVDFRPFRGQARCRIVDEPANAPIEPILLQAMPAHGDVELF